MFQEIRSLMKYKYMTNTPYVVNTIHYNKLQTIDWGLKALGVPEVWRETKGAGVKVAVLDTGCYAHMDLVKNIKKVRNFTNEDISNVDDYVGHGTHCAGIIAAVDNGDGVVGVAPECDLMIGKVLDDHGRGRIEWIAEGIYWAVSEGANIISMSLGGPGDDPRLRGAVEHALENNVAVVVAAGNSGEGSDTVMYPGAYPGVITVGSIKSTMERSTYSSTGPTLEIMAPGEDILSTWRHDKYARISGTSMACPFVAGVCALILSRDAENGYSITDFGMQSVNEYLTNCLILTADDMEEEGWDKNTGWGVVDPQEAYKK